MLRNLFNHWIIIHCHQSLNFRNLILYFQLYLSDRSFRWFKLKESRKVQKLLLYYWLCAKPLLPFDHLLFVKYVCNLIWCSQDRWEYKEDHLSCLLRKLVIDVKEVACMIIVRVGLIQDLLDLDQSPCTINNLIIVLVTIE